MKKRSWSVAGILVIAALLLASCGNASGTASGEQQQGSQETAQVAKSTAEESVPEETEAASEITEEEPVEEEQTEEPAEAEPGGEAYAWQGLQDMPKCNYLDCFVTYHYIREFTNMSMGYYTDTVEAVDGVNTYTGFDGGTRTYLVDGRALSINDMAKNYTETDMGSIAETAKEALASAMASGENYTGRAFAGTGKEVIPDYGEHYDDETEYEYYEYNYPSTEELGMTMIERFYMKDGDVFAIYRETSMDGEVMSKSTELIKSISTEIPGGTFDIPDLEGYEKIEF